MTKQDLAWKLHGVRFALKALNRVNYAGTFGHGKINHGDKEAKRAALKAEESRLAAQLAATT